MTEGEGDLDLLAERRLRYGRGLAAIGRHAEAVDLYVQTLELAPRWPAAHVSLAESLIALGRTDEARAALRAGLAADPADGLGLGVRLALLGDMPEGAMSPAFVATLFDQYADRFDGHLREKLAYCGPQVVADLLGRVRGDEPLAYVIDLGCGTGLMAAALVGVRRIDGIDLSAAMLTKARAKGRYTALVAGEMVEVLTAPASGLADTSADAILAADVLVYCGDLAPLMRAVAGRLARGGVFVFTVQTPTADAPDRPFGIGADHRYWHRMSYIESVAHEADLAPAQIEEASTRTDRGLPVPGLVAAFKRGGGGERTP